MSWARRSQKGAETGVTPTFCLTGDDKALGQGHSTWAIVLSHKMAFKCKFPLGPKGDLASALALLIRTNMWSALIYIMGRMEMRGQLCQLKTKRRKKKGRQTDAILLNCICTTQRCDILSLIWPLLIMIRGYIEYCHSCSLTKALWVAAKFEITKHHAYRWCRNTCLYIFAFY